MRFAITSLADGTLMVLVPSATSLRRLAAGEITINDLEQILTADAVKNGGTLHIVSDEATIRSKLPFADGSPNAPASRIYRRTAMKWNAATQMVEDDQKITTEREIVEAVSWDQENAIGKAEASRTLAERKLAAGRPDLLSVADTDDIVVRWRASGRAPAPSSFVPPADRVKPDPLPRRSR